MYNRKGARGSGRRRRRRPRRAARLRFVLALARVLTNCEISIWCRSPRIPQLVAAAGALMHVESRASAYFYVFSHNPAPGAPPDLYMYISTSALAPRDVITDSSFSLCPATPPAARASAREVCTQAAGHYIPGNALPPLCEATCEDRENFRGATFCAAAAPAPSPPDNCARKRAAGDRNLITLFAFLRCAV